MESTGRLDGNAMAYDTPILTAKDLGLDSEEPALDVHQLPQLYTKPSAKTILSTLNDLKSQPSSWKNTPHSGTPRSLSGASTPLRKRPKIRSSGVPQYLTKIIASSLAWIEDDEEKELVWETAAQRLSERSGRTAMGDIVRTFSIPLGPCMSTKLLPSGNLSTETALALDVDEDVVEITLHEPALTGDNLGLKTWASSFLLAKRLCLLRACLPQLSDADWILELGAGTGLVGMVAAAVFHKQVVLTDLPEIVHNLERNVRSNTAMIRVRGGGLRVATLDWARPAAFSLPDDIMQHYPTPSTRLILAADPIYSDEHPKLLVQAISHHLSRDIGARVVIEMPVREAYGAEREEFRRNMVDLGLQLMQEGEEFGFDDWTSSGCEDEDEREEVKCWWSIWGWVQ